MLSFLKSPLPRLLALGLIAAATVSNTPVLSEENTLPEMDKTELPKILTSIKYYTSRKYILGPNDIISITVADGPEFNQKGVRVQPDGNIVLTGIGPINVSGMTVEELYATLVDHYRHYLRDPKVAINLDSMKPFIVYVSGAVVTPGSYELEADTSKYQAAPDQNRPDIQVIRKTPLLSNVLVATGGLTYRADLENIKIVNAHEGTEMHVNLLDLINKNDTAQDIYLMPGDSIQVPELPLAKAAHGETYAKFSNTSFAQKQIPIRVYGYVNSPGLVSLNTSQSNRLNSAIVAAGGYSLASPYAPNKVYVSRVLENGKLATLSVNPKDEDMTLMPNDVVYVPEKTRPQVAKAFDYMSRIIAPINATAASYNNWALMFNPTRSQFQPPSY